VLAIGFFSIAGALVGPIADEREDLQLTLSDEVRESMPAHMVVLTAALGSFRGLIANYLWMRADSLQTEGRYHEANQMATWITALQPQFEQVWVFQAWNMAYNISVATYTPQERWNWVNRGISLLREQGIQANPLGTEIYRQLGWILWHKVQGNTDDMHWFYKAQFVFDMQELLGRPPRGLTTEQAVEQFRDVAEAHGSIEELLADRREDPSGYEMIGPGVVAEPVWEFMQERGYTPDEAFAREIGRLRMFRESLQVALLDLPLDHESIRIDPGLAPLVDDDQYAEGLELILNVIRRQVLLDRYNMHPGMMLGLMEKFGPIDWRHPAAHGAYWFDQGVRRATQRVYTDDIDQLNLDRNTIHAFQTLQRYGRISFRPSFVPRGGQVDMMPDPRFIPAYEAAMEEAIARVNSGRFRTKRDTGFYEKGHENFLLKAVSDFYLYGDERNAAKYWAKAKRLYAAEEHNKREARYEMDLPEYVASRLKDDLEISFYSKAFIDAMIFRGFTQGLVLGEERTFARFLEIGKIAHQKFQSSKHASTPLAERHRAKLLPWDQLVENAFKEFIISPNVSLPDRAVAWRTAPLELRQAAYDLALPALETQFAAIESRVSIDRAFPEPPGMEAIREARAERKLEQGEAHDPLSEEVGVEQQ